MVQKNCKISNKSVLCTLILKIQYIHIFINITKFDQNMTYIDFFKFFKADAHFFNFTNFLYQLQSSTEFKEFFFKYTNKFF